MPDRKSTIEWEVKPIENTELVLCCNATYPEWRILIPCIDEHYPQDTCPLHHHSTPATTPINPDPCDTIVTVIMRSRSLEPLIKTDLRNPFPFLPQLDGSQTNGNG